MFVTGLVLAAGSSSRLGRPKQLLPFAGGTLLDATLDVARHVGFDQLIVALGGAGDAVRSAVDLQGIDVVDNLAFATGCSSSIRSALPVVDDRASGLVLLLGDQPTVRPSNVRRLVAEAGGAPLGICLYANGLGHPVWLGREVFGELAELHGDKGVWKVLESGRHAVVEVPAEGDIPPDVDTWDDYTGLLAADG